MINNLHEFQSKLYLNHKGTKYDNLISTKFTKYDVVVSHKNESGIIKPEYENLTLSSKNISLSTESLCFFVHLNGHNKNLLLFLISFHANKETLIFNWDSSVINEYFNFCETLELEVPTLKVVLETIKKLASKKVITNVSRRVYMLNPILIGGIKENEKKKLLNNYSKYALLKKKVTHDELYPTIYNLKGVK